MYSKLMTIDVIVWVLTYYAIAPIMIYHRRAFALETHDLLPQGPRSGERVTSNLYTYKHALTLYMLYVLVRREAGSQGLRAFQEHIPGPLRTYEGPIRCPSYVPSKGSCAALGLAKLHQG